MLKHADRPNGPITALVSKQDLRFGNLFNKFFDHIVMCAPSSQVDTTLEHVDNVITVRISRENLDSENPLLLSQSMPWRQSETMSLNMKAFLNLEFGLTKT